MALPLNGSVECVRSQEGDYGTELNMLRRAPPSTTTHPLEAAEKTYHQRQEKLRTTTATRTFGLGFALHQRHEKAAAGWPTIGHLGALPRSNAHLQALTGADLLMDFGDTLNMEPELLCNPHQQMEKVFK